MPTDVAEVASDPISQICALCRWGSSQPKVLRWQQFAGPLFPQSEVVNIPWLQDTEATERRLWPGSPSSPGSLGSPGSPSAEKSNESRFSVNLREVLDISRSSFAVSKGDGTDTLFKASVVAGGILALTEVDGKDPDILLRAGSGQKRLLTIMEGNSSYFGKIEIADSRGMVLYHMQKPCATITADVKDLSMQVYPLSADAKFLRAASMIKKGEAQNPGVKEL